MIVRAMPIEGVKYIAPPTNFEDCRGGYVELWNKQLYKLGIDFVTDDISVSRKGVLRGIHGDHKTWKLVTCLYGAFYLVVIDNRVESETFGEWLSFTLSDKQYFQILIPPGCGNGHLVLTDVAIFHYKQSEYYDRESQFTIQWDDPSLDIYWPIGKPILSERDAGKL